VNHINILMFSTSKSPVLSAQATVLGFEAQLASCKEGQRVTAKVDSLLVTDKRALAADYQELVSIMPESGRKCLQVTYASHSRPQPARDTARSSTAQMQGVQS
jgi:hypothetical protein